MNKYIYEITKTISVEIEAENLTEAFDQMHARLENDEFDNFFLHSHSVVRLVDHTEENNK